MNYQEYLDFIDTALFKALYGGSKPIFNVSTAYVKGIQFNDTKLVKRSDSEYATVVFNFGDHYNYSCYINEDIVIELGYQALITEGN